MRIQGQGTVEVSDVHSHAYAGIGTYIITLAHLLPQTTTEKDHLFSRGAASSKGV